MWRFIVLAMPCCNQFHSPNRTPQMIFYLCHFEELSHIRHRKIIGFTSIVSSSVPQIKKQKERLKIYILLFHIVFNDAN